MAAIDGLGESRCVWIEMWLMLGSITIAAAAAGPNGVYFVDSSEIIFCGETWTWEVWVGASPTNAHLISITLRHYCIGPNLLLDRWTHATERKKKIVTLYSSLNLTNYSKSKPRVAELPFTRGAQLIDINGSLLYWEFTCSLEALDIQYGTQHDISPNNTLAQYRYIYIYEFFSLLRTKFKKHPIHIGRSF